MLTRFGYQSRDSPFQWERAMMIGQTKPLNVLSSSGPAQWKPQVTASNSGVFQATGTAKDSVSVSKLGQALSGVAADAFKHLDSKARGVLENLVNSGRISADDAVLGLRSMATQATFSRYGRERPRDHEDEQRLASSNSLLDKQRALNDRMGAAREAFGQAFSGLQEAQERGDAAACEALGRDLEAAGIPYIAARAGQVTENADGCIVPVDGSGLPPCLNAPFVVEARGRMAPVS